MRKTMNNEQQNAGIMRLASTLSTPVSLVDGQPCGVKWLPEEKSDTTYYVSKLEEAKVISIGLLPTHYVIEKTTSVGVAHRVARNLAEFFNYEIMERV
jgi:hypothetical protein